MTWHVVGSPHLFRRTAKREKVELESLVANESPVAQDELKERGIDPMAQFRVGPRRWQGFWRVEQYR